MINKELLRNQSADFGVGLNETALDRFDIYAKLLVDWNEKMNLTGITAPDEIVTKHFVDSLAVSRHCDLKADIRLVDVGTGAGFPSIPLLIANPHINAVLIDSLAKRLSFLQAVLDECGLKATLIHGRAEELGKDPSLRETFDIATARAVAPMNMLAEYCLPFVKIGGSLIALKGSDDDVTPAAAAIATLGGEIAHLDSYNLPNGDGRSVAVVNKISQTPTKYPRKNKKITTQPL
ncbi:MAG: 16S rRNA (guanine(527)-N(7))-methyltransferase RsmG [Eubacterium sp.]